MFAAALYIKRKPKSPFTVLGTAKVADHGSIEATIKHLELQRDRWTSNGPPEYREARYKIEAVDVY